MILSVFDVFFRTFILYMHSPILSTESFEQSPPEIYHVCTRQYRVEIGIGAGDTGVALSVCLSVKHHSGENKVIEGK